MGKGNPASTAQPRNRERLLSVTTRDLDIQTFHAGGKGGQNQNTRDTGVRIVHRESGAVGEARDERSQWQNKKLALKRMTQDRRFQVWVNRMVWFAGESPEKRAERDMQPRNLKVEGRTEGGWAVI